MCQLNTFPLILITIMWENLNLITVMDNKYCFINNDIHCFIYLNEKIYILFSLYKQKCARVCYSTIHYKQIQVKVFLWVCQYVCVSIRAEDWVFMENVNYNHCLTHTFKALQGITEGAWGKNRSAAWFL